MVIYLSHPQHGMKVAISEAEALADEQNGWGRFDPNRSVVPVPVATSVEPTTETFIEPLDSERDELTKQYVDKFGRKPHWKLSVENIRKELEEVCQQPSI